MRLHVRMVGTAHERGAGAVGKTHLRRLGREHPEDVGMDIPAHRQMVAGGCKVLADGEHLDVVGTQAAKGLNAMLKAVTNT